MSASDISIADCLQLLDGDFSRMRNGVANHEYALWLGSGISRGRLEGVSGVVERLLVFLQEHSVSGANQAEFREALNAAFRIIGIDPTTLGIDLDAPVSKWPSLDIVISGLANRYSHVLDIRIAVDGLPNDYLVWEVLDIPATYGDPTLEPDCEHLCVAVLLLESFVQHVVTANWDPLIEKALALISGGDVPVNVCVLDEELRRQRHRGTIFKFHGCAVLALRDPARYREALVAREEQIISWRNDNRAMHQALVHLVSTERTLMIGLSIQDSDIQNIFMDAHDVMPWRWPEDPSAYVFAENDLGADQLALLRAVYRDAYAGGQRVAIESSARFPAFAKQLLLALLLQSITEKLKALITVADAPGLAIREKLLSGVVALRDRFLPAPGSDLFAYIQQFIVAFARMMLYHSRGDLFDSRDLRYIPLTRASLAELAMQGNEGLSRAPELAVALGLLGEGLESRGWTVDRPTPDALAPALLVESGGAAVRIFIAANENVAARLQASGLFGYDSDDTVVLHCDDIVPGTFRSPRSLGGRTGTVGLREVSIRALLERSPDEDELMRRFCLEVAI